MAKQHPAQTKDSAGPKTVTLPKTSMTPEEMQAEINRLTAENDVMKRQNGQTAGVSLRVSDKGALSVYGMGRFPVTLYREQWEKLLGAADEIRQFIVDNDSKLKRKEEKPAA